VLRVKVKVGIPPVSCGQHDDLLHSYGCERQPAKPYSDTIPCLCAYFFEPLIGENRVF
jgi:hypothetical protein